MVFVRESTTKGEYMTRKDYEAIASAILSVRGNIEARNLDVVRLSSEWGITNEIIDKLVTVFANDNPRFQADKFREACGLF